ncbi:uncharacterized protein LOC125474221 [Pyrus x bretschneideri]|uniref:uncharacterized protein LOC125474221 n=1 Tax=Pyrus x bretschneideri TaxID=225117 RepID=UPI002030A29D|nr:uncharacterized protein LOC125474221 [Pyrus x bretschneideri]
MRLEEFDESEKSELQTALEVLLQNDDRTDRMDVIWAQHDYTIEGLLAVALSGCTENKVLVLAVAEYVHYNAKTIDLISSQDKLFMLLNKTSVSHCPNQHKCPACSPGRKIFSGSCNALPIVTDGDTATERTLWLIKQRARLCQKNKMRITSLVMITMLGWIPGVKAAEKKCICIGAG